MIVVRLAGRAGALLLFCESLSSSICRELVGLSVELARLAKHCVVVASQCQCTKFQCKVSYTNTHKKRKETSKVKTPKEVSDVGMML